MGNIRIFEFLISLIHEFYWILKMFTVFYFEIQYFNSDRKITITLLHSYRNTQQRQVYDVTATVGKTPLCKICKSADAKKVILYTP